MKTIFYELEAGNNHYDNASRNKWISVIKIHLITFSVQMFGFRTSQIFTRWIILYGAQLKYTNCTFRDTKVELMDKIKVVYENIHRKTLVPACLRFESRIDAVKLVIL